MLKKFLLVFLAVSFMASFAFADNGKDLSKQEMIAQFNQAIETVRVFVTSKIAEADLDATTTSVTPMYQWGAWLIILKILSFLAFLVLVAVAIAFYGKNLALVSGTIEKKISRTFWFGLLAILLIVPVVLLLAISLVGIVLIPAWLILVFIAGLFGYAAAAQYVGARLAKLLKRKKTTQLGDTVLGLVTLMIIGIVPFLGGLIKAFVCLSGLGAVVLTRFGTQKD
ncbi:MAG: hypothetical protein ABIE84_03180 [bacterium]